tara:strand:+ start:190 stop:378 length:189 start_codon:yes stop_codon:yes gene_type:complete
LEINKKEILTITSKILTPENQTKVVITILEILAKEILTPEIRILGKKQFILGCPQAQKLHKL